MHGAYVAFMFFVQISKQTATFVLLNITRLVLYNRDAECLQRGTDWVSIYKRLRFVFKGLKNKGFVCGVFS